MDKTWSQFSDTTKSSPTGSEKVHDMKVDGGGKKTVMVV